MTLSASQCSQYLSEAYAALHAVQVGKKRTVVRFDNRSVQYSQTNIGELRAYIAELERQCGDTEKFKRQPFGVCW